MTMIPVFCHGCGQRGKVASIPEDLACAACLSTDIDLDDRTAAGLGDAVVDTLRENHKPGKCVHVYCDKDAVQGRSLCVEHVAVERTEQAWDKHGAIQGDPDMAMGLLPNDQPEMGLLGDPQVITESVRCSTCFHQFTQQVTDPSAPMLPCPKCGADTVTAAGTTTAAQQPRPLACGRCGHTWNSRAQFRIKCPSCGAEENVRNASKTAGENAAPYKITGDGPYKVVNDKGEVKGTHDTYDEARDQQKALYANVPGASEQAERKHKESAADQRRPEEIAHQRELEQKPQSQLTGEDEVDLARLRQQQRGNPISNPYTKGGNPYAAKVQQIAAAVLASNPGMAREAALAVAEKTVQRYPKVAG